MIASKLRNRGRTLCSQWSGYGRQAGRDQIGREDVVKADDAHVLGHHRAQGGEAPQQPDGQKVVVGQYSRRGMGAQRFRRLRPAVDGTAAWSCRPRCRRRPYFGGRPPPYFGCRDTNPFVLQLCSTSRPAAKSPPIRCFDARCIS